MTRTTIDSLYSILTAVVAFFLFAATAVASPFTNLVVFGDSLSDAGNISQSTPFFTQPKTPGPYYWNGRFSNGPIYAESMATGLGLPALVHSKAGGSDFAYGRAQTTGTTFPTNLVVRDVDDQVGDFLGGPAADPNALFVVFAGANDLLDTQVDVSIPVNSLNTSINRLIADGAHQLLVFNLPLLGNTPRYNGSATTHDQYNTRSQQYNTALATMLDTVQTANPAVNIFRLDVAAFFSQIIANPALFGLTNVTDSAAPGLEPGATSYNTSLLVPNPNEYVFWDDLHPTKAVHAILAQRALDLFREPGDYNPDGTVDAADYVTWRNGLGSIYSPYDYELWRSHFGETTWPLGTLNGFEPGADAGLTVPEPQAVTPLLLALAVIISRSRGVSVRSNCCAVVHCGALAGVHNSSDQSLGPRCRRNDSHRSSCRAIMN